MRYIECTVYGGFDQHDVHEETAFLKEADGYGITDADAAIARDVRSTMLEMKESTWYKGQETETRLAHIPSVEEILELIKRGETITAQSTSDAEFGSRMGYEYDPLKKTASYYYGYGQFAYTCEYVIHDVLDGDIRYAACENFLCPRKGVPSIVRFYHAPYGTAKEAEDALEAMQLHDGYDSAKELIILDPGKMGTEWYKLNLEAASLAQKATGSAFRADVKEHLEELRKALMAEAA